MTRIWIAVLLSFVLAGCSTVSPRTIPDGYFLLVAHSSGGPAPFSSNLAIYPDGSAAYRAATGRMTMFRVSRQAIAELEKLLAGHELTQQLDALTVRSRPYSDHEQWWFVINGHETTFICREITPSPAVVALIDAVRRAARGEIRDRWFMSSTCGGDIAG